MNDHEDACGLHTHQECCSGCKMFAALHNCTSCSRRESVERQCLVWFGSAAICKALTKARLKSMHPHGCHIRYLHVLLDKAILSRAAKRRQCCVTGTPLCTVRPSSLLHTTVPNEEHHGDAGEATIRQTFGMSFFDLRFSAHQPDVVSITDRLR